MNPLLMCARSVPGAGPQRGFGGVGRVGEGGSAPKSQDATRAVPAPVLHIHSMDKRGKELP